MVYPPFEPIFIVAQYSIVIVKKSKLIRNFVFTYLSV
jgi:hypothetical protein